MPVVTAAGLADLGARSDRDELPVLAPGDAQPVAYLAHCRVGPDRSEDRRHEVAVCARHTLALVHRRRPGVPGPLRPDATEPLDLVAFAARIDPLGRRRGDLVVAVLVHSDHDLLARVDRALDPVRRLLDLALLEPALDRGEGAADAIDLVEVCPRGRLQLVRE